ncbi:GIY-YIG nuclease family protein [Flaviaesturariibacter aridisoli]|uniref:GIY-YIG nuclease family protein n=1 Tax=Flaviaesturariibacter aridisoli TaxID=2545761 RepID=A0A4V2WMM3_9BACT|nr:GIY-YIG nuclease family protein [Flaviaesturariibacter aridisoli]
MVSSTTVRGEGRSFKSALPKGEAFLCPVKSFCGYIIYAASLDQYYLGSTGNLEDRLYRHRNSGSKGTKKAKDWALRNTESCAWRAEALNREAACPCSIRSIRGPATAPGGIVWARIPHLPGSMERVFVHPMLPASPGHKGCGSHTRTSPLPTTY